MLLGALVLADRVVVAAPSGSPPIREASPRATPPDSDGARKSDDPLKLTPAQLRARAIAAEKAGDWESAFAAWCELYVTDRTGTDTRERLNAALRHTQQIRRHRDTAYRQFVTGLAVSDAVALFAETAAKVPGMFADPTRATPQQLWENGIEELQRALALPGFRQAFLGSPAPNRVDSFRNSLRTSWMKRSIPDARAARDTLKQLIAAAQDTFPVRTPSALAVEVVCGACSGLDEYTVFLTPGSASDAPDTPADLAAYGLSLTWADGGLLIDGVAPGSWAAFSSLRKGQRVVKLNGRAMDGANSSGLVEGLRVPLNGAHELELAIPGDPNRTTVRLPLIVPTVYGDRIVEPKEGVGYLRIGEFLASTPRELTDAIASLKHRGMRALVLDLRGNQGGSFVAGVEVARRLLPHGLIVTTQGQLGQVANQVFSSDSGMAALDVPLVVLIDAETASAAEVVAAAIRDNERGILVGMPTFGKGTIQYPLKLTAADEAEGSTRPRSGTVRLTIAQLIAPRGGAINGIGITPHVIESSSTQQIDVAILRALDLLQPPMRSPLPMPPDQ
jgi:C-terminal peptidase prc